MPNIVRLFKLKTKQKTQTTKKEWFIEAMEYLTANKNDIY